MNKSQVSMRIERWNVSTPKSDSFPDGRKFVTKIAARTITGQFHGATNFRGTVIE